MVSPSLQGIFPGRFNTWPHFELGKFRNYLLQISVFPDIGIECTSENAAEQPMAFIVIRTGQNLPDLVFSQVIIPQKIRSCRCHAPIVSNRELDGRGHGGFKDNFGKFTDVWRGNGGNVFGEIFVRHRKFSHSSMNQRSVFFSF